MFTAKQSKLFDTKAAAKTTKAGSTGVTNPFVLAGLKKSAETLSGNGALKYSTTGNPFVDQFGVLGSYKKPRTFAEIEKDCEILWASNKLTATQFLFYVRLITRVTQLPDGSTTQTSQKGGELRHEGIMRMIWLSQKAPETFWKNIGIFISVGSWKDIITMLQYDLVYNGWENKVLDWKQFGNLILSGLNKENTVNLLKKYLPQLQATSKCKTVEAQADTLIAKWICSLLFGPKEAGQKEGKNYKAYRKLKTSGTAHDWQKLISQRKFKEIDFSKVHGRALNKLVRSKFLKNQGLEDTYNQWILKPETEVKFTGFVHELFSKLPAALSGLNVSERETINKQFSTLVQKGGQTEQTPLIVVRDTSSSMGDTATGTNMSCYNVAKALALYFSEFLHGRFAQNWIEFNSDAKMHEWKGSTPLERWYNDKSGYVGGTDFQRVIKLLCKIKAEGVDENDFPTGILCISDSEFNPTQLGKTNVDTALDTLRRAGFSDEYVSNFVIVLWNLQSSYYGASTGKKFETFGDVKNVFYFSGYSAATVSFLTNKIKTAAELVEEALSQEVLQMVSL
jgi:hypothetical protein